MTQAEPEKKEYKTPDIKSDRVDKKYLMSVAMGRLSQTGIEPTIEIFITMSVIMKELFKEDMRDKLLWMHVGGAIYGTLGFVICWAYFVVPLFFSLLGAG